MKAKNRWVFSIALLTLTMLAGTYHLTASTELALRYVPTTHKVVALTFDDGPHPQTTPQILRVLKEKQVKTTFFVLGSNAATHPEWVKQAAQDGHEIGSHAYSHRFFNTLKTTEYEAEMDQTNQLICQLAHEPAVFRPPGGSWNDAVARAALLRGQTTILWSVDTGDWRRLPVGQVVKNTLDNVKPGSIVLMHDGQPALPTAEAVGIIIDKLRDKGYQFVTVSELLQYYEVRH
ncbi:polysaccharide deacetylase [Anaerosporomusa subterranea]|uniref:Polysaccharide deacetylase n=2 Tax=Anaerosporomusa subterranea TaxID=1794912 RepID=A0A154BSE4_ANASB|nr:polysaccharide deacetylase family protein [Anaerosporomusa subterranea]KYZ76886.1 polysaccharide deacetylase [Anaerosporomusa subterranea]